MKYNPSLYQSQGIFAILDKVKEKANKARDHLKSSQVTAKAATLTISEPLAKGCILWRKVDLYSYSNLALADILLHSSLMILVSFPVYKFYHRIVNISFSFMKSSVRRICGKLVSCYGKNEKNHCDEKKRGRWGS